MTPMSSAPRDGTATINHSAVMRTVPLVQVLGYGMLFSAVLFQVMHTSVRQLCRPLYPVSRYFHLGWLCFLRSIYLSNSLFPTMILNINHVNNTASVNNWPRWKLSTPLLRWPGNSAPSSPPTRDPGLRIWGLRQVRRMGLGLGWWSRCRCRRCLI